MKKTYINPEMDIVKLTSTHSLLQASVENLNGDAKEETVGFSRGFSFGDDGEE